MAKFHPTEAAGRLFGVPLMLDATKGAVIAQAFGPRLLSTEAVDVDVVAAQTADQAASHATAHADAAALTPKASSFLNDGLFRSGRAAGYATLQGVAIVMVTGTLVRRGAHLGESSGMTSYEGLSAQIRAAVEDPDVRAIALEIDSFGGEANGIFDLAAEIRAARAVKPVRAFVADYALSAGYAIASQADHITLSPHGKVGSVGVITMHFDHEKHLEQEGIKVSIIKSGAKKAQGNPYEALDADVRDAIQADSDRMWSEFAQLVETGRKGRISMADALALEAGVFTGSEALSKGLADSVGEARASFTTWISELNGSSASVAAPQASGSGCTSGAVASQHQENEMSNITNQPATTPAPTQAVQSGADAIVAQSSVEQERARASAITKKVAQAGLSATFATSLIEDNLSLEAAYDKILDEKAAQSADGGEIRTAGAARVTGDAVDRTREGMTRALALRAGLNDGERNEFAGMSLREMARASLSARGLTAPNGGVMALASAAFVPTMAGGMHTTSDFGNILADIANKSMMRGFDEVEESFPRFTSVGSLGDFKPNTRVGLDIFPSLDKVSEGAEFKYGTMGDHGESVMLATYGKLFAVTRQTIINDDLDAISRVPARMGRAAKRTIGDLVFAVLKGNPQLSDGKALFHADHSNLAASGGAPSEATVNAIITAMAMQKSGKANLNIPLAFLLAPPSLRSVILQTLKSEYAPDDTAKAGTTKQPNAHNTVRDAAVPIFDARLEGTAWYGSADPNLADTIEVSYLDGNQNPFLEQQQGWTVDGTEFKVRIDAAASPLAFQGLYKNPGQ